MSSNLPFLAVEHIGLAATQPRRLADWYLRVLDASEIWSNGEEPPAVFVRLPGGTVLEIYPAGSTSNRIGDNAVAGWRHLALRVGDLEAAVATLESRGVVFPMPTRPAGGGGQVRFFADPEGNLLHLVARPADSPMA